MTAASGASIARDRFQQLWRSCLVNKAKDESASIHNALLQAYCEPQRFYHSLDHIEHCMEMFDQSSSLMDNPDAVQLAIWMHDVVYQPGATDNEARSVAWYKKIARAAHAPKLRQLVCRMIMATAHDGNAADEVDSRYMVDIDLSSFALPWDEFLRDSQNLRRENAQISDQQYYRNQKKFQKSLLARKRFFKTDYFYQKYEAGAHQNLARYFDYIDSATGPSESRV